MATLHQQHMPQPGFWSSHKRLIVLAGIAVLVAIIVAVVLMVSYSGGGGGGAGGGY